MKYLVVILCIVIAVLVLKNRNTMPSSQQPTEGGVQEVASQPKPSAPVVPPAAPAEQTLAPGEIVQVAAGQTSVPVATKHFAPEGTFYLLQRIAVTTDTGVIGIVPGTRVTLVKGGTPMRVSNGEFEFDAGPEQLTNDLDLAAKVSQADRSSQTMIAEMRARKIQELHNQQAQAQMQSTQTPQPIQA
jgi:hypothetical protein